MLIDNASGARSLRKEELSADLVIVGGGLAGTCATITAARAGLKVVLIQDRPVLGGNASSEVRLWALGATSHMGNNNRWAREGGVIDEILVENQYRNPEGNPLILDTVLLEKVVSEPNVTLLLNTAAHEVTKRDADTIASVRAFCSQNSTTYDVCAPLFCDASGDGIIGFLAGAAFRMGAEARDEFDEGFAPSHEYGELLGHSIYFYTKDTGRPVSFVPPSFALKDLTQIPRYRQFNAREDGCRLWWIEYGGRLDTVHATEAIKWELWKVVYGVWNHIKNSGEFPEAENMTLEWVGTIPGKRESRRFEGDYMLSQRDLIEQRKHADAVSFGGWAVDLHPADGVFSEMPGCTQWHSKGVYQIPYRSLYSRNIRNLFLGGRLMSATHVAFGSTRVMLTCAHNAQAIAHAAKLCREEDCLPRELGEPQRVASLQRNLLRSGQCIPHHHLDDEHDLAQQAAISASSEFVLDTLNADGPWITLDQSRALLVPLPAGRVPQFTFSCQVEAPTDLRVELRTSSRLGNFTPDITLAAETIALQPEANKDALERVPAAAAVVNGHDRPETMPESLALDAADDLSAGHCAAAVDFDVELDKAQYAIICLMQNPAVQVRQAQQNVTGLLGLMHGANKAVATQNTQTSPEDIGIERFEFWLPERRPKGRLLACQFEPPVRLSAPDWVCNGIHRPTCSTNAWIADPADLAPTLTLRWNKPQTIRQIDLVFDTDADHPMESVLMGHPERVMPYCVRKFRVLDDQGHTVAACNDNHQTIWSRELDEPLTTSSLRIMLEHPSEQTPAALFAVRCY